MIIRGYRLNLPGCRMAVILDGRSHMSPSAYLVRVAIMLLGQAARIAFGDRWSLSLISGNSSALRRATIEGAFT